ncbi:Vacuolar protein-sorting-associated protein [Schistosoma japonicum]|uniref:Vacuolar protein-sorting-associated protein 36 n=1 Tax=Schistosoma japonicum TaxID=6182 RepID=Q5DEX2_SCHJA|nr:SJCHGC05176 protein [Schistosoma japonicum]KAH8858311.1 Vacuolar protein-sorting-associated protein 36 [Schistosoma japonicum]KAH8858312.1 Vacuolar protein-sorting-associated protein 36 [Schistosoma japonicum]KAH8858313.1 Vacuolar protein-sorting-associated protein 36 [Schistosoma japonicum]KAH8858314.1 Vacuolar protein-sorting-associated protein 36 [Schistosoma japonicum]
MDRFRWCSDDVENYGSTKQDNLNEETIVLQKPGVRLYDGPNRSAFDNGLLKLTTHRLLWSNPFTPTSSFIALPLAAIISVKVEDSGNSLAVYRTPKLILRLLTVAALQNVLSSLPNPPQWIEQWCGVGNLGSGSDSTTFSATAVVSHSREDHIKLGFPMAGHQEFLQSLNEVLQVKLWTLSYYSDSKFTTKSYGTGGIGAIQRQQAARAVKTDRNITETFEDLSQLMSNANEMVKLSRILAKKIRDTKGSDLSANEIAELRSAMLSMGVMEVVSGDERGSSTSSTSSTTFYVQLAHQVSKLLFPLLKGQYSNHSDDRLYAGCIDLATAYCRVNRARGMDLISPEDLLRACRYLDKEGLPVRLKGYANGLLVLQLASEDEMETLKSTADLVEKRTSLSVDELARTVNLSPFLAKARLLAVEEAGLICRDDSEAGLRFYPNYFITRPD